MGEPKNVDVSVTPFEWAIKDLTQPTLKEMGLDLKDGYAALKRIAANAIKKNSKPGIANKRVAMEVLRAGGFAESDIAVEYFGGILSESKTETGEDDSGIYYTDIIKSLSSKQLHLHYIIYNSLQKVFISNPEKYSGINIGMEPELEKNQIFFNAIELEFGMQLKTDRNIIALVNSGLIGKNFEVNTKTIKEKTINFAKVTPTVLGIQIYAIANGKLTTWRNYNKENFGDFKDIKLPSVYKMNEEDL